MKQAIKSILPQTLLNKARAFRDYGALNAVQVLDFDETALRAENDLNLDEIWSDETIAADWQNDQSQIKNTFKEEERWGGINMGDRRALYTLIRALNPKNVLEAGTHIGTSTLYIARALKANGNAEKTPITTVDILDVNNPQTGAWPGLGMRQSPAENLNELSCDNMVNFIAQPAQNYMKAAAQSGEKFDFIFLDGDHTSHGVYHEMELALKILSKDGVILLHDYYPDGRPLFADNSIIYGPFVALEKVKQVNPNVAVKPLGNLPWDTKQNSKATSLACVVKKSVVKKK